MGQGSRLYRNMEPINRFHPVKAITYFTSDMSTSADVCMQSVHRYGMTGRAYSSVDPTFRMLNPVMNEVRGAGYWLWKPYILLKEMMQSDDGDVVVYMDAGVEMIDEPTWLKGLDNVWLFGNQYKHEDWCKGDVMDAIYHGPYDKQVQASVVAVRVNGWTKTFVKEWLTWCEMPGFLDDSPSKSKNRKGFQEHRHDQAILTCLAYKYGIPLHWWPARYNKSFDYPKNGYRDNYGVCFNHHRFRNRDWI
jgi:hypothetical protein